VPPPAAIGGHAVGVHLEPSIVRTRPGGQAWRLSSVDYATRQPNAPAAKRLRVIGMIVATRVNHQGTIDYICQLQSRRQHGIARAAVRCDVQSWQISKMPITPRFGMSLRCLRV